MEYISIAQCRNLIGRSAAKTLSEEGLLRMRQMLYVLADVITDAYADLGNIDQRTFETRNDFDALLYGDTHAQ